MLGHLSKGYRQRVGLAEAMVHDPDILILDEPTAGLDPIQIREVRALIRELGDRHTILLSTHIMQEVEAVCSRVLLIARGRIAIDERLDRLREGLAVEVEARGPSDADPKGPGERPGRRPRRRLGRQDDAFIVHAEGGRGLARGDRRPDRPERLGIAAARPPAIDAGRPLRPGRRDRRPMPSEAEGEAA